MRLLPMCALLVASLFLIATAEAATFEGTAANGQVGDDVAGIGDVDHDGFDDVLVGAPGGNFGSVYLFPGSPMGPSLTWSWTVTGPRPACQSTPTYFGTSVAGIGDIDGDGFPDFAIGQPGYDECGPLPLDIGPRGAVHFYRGSAGGPIGAGIKYGSWYGQYFGARVAGAGDVNGDGYDDVIVASPSYGPNTIPPHVTLFQGSPSGLGSGQQILKPSEAAVFGGGLAPAGDVNGDGFDDVIVTDHLGDTATSFLYLGSPTGLASTPVLSFAGRVGKSNGDFNGDGFGDVVVGDGASASIHFGSGTGLSATPGWTVTDSIPGRQFGAVVGSAGDLDEDGIDDVLIVAGAEAGGQVLVYLGAPGGPGPGPGWIIDPPDPSIDWFGSAAAGAGDFSGGGPGEVVIGSPHADTAAGTEAGRVDLLTFVEGVCTEPDADGDGYWGPACPWFTDCDDGAPTVHPGAAEICDGIDQDCDGISDDNAALPDPDADGRGDCADNCPAAHNPGQENADGDTTGDACDPCPLDAANDADADGHCADGDNCPLVANADQLDLDNDGQGDICDPDDGEIHVRFTSPAALDWYWDTGQFRFNIYRGMLSTLEDADADGAAESYGSCLARNLASPPYFDADTPPLGDGFLYIVTGLTGSSESSPGVASSGAPRPMPAPACGSSVAHVPVIDPADVVGATTAVACDFTSAWNYALLYDYGFDVQVTPGPLLLGGSYTEAAAGAIVTDADSLPGMNDVLRVFANFGVGAPDMQVEVTLLDDGSASSGSFEQQGGIREACVGAPLPSECLPATYATGSGDATAADDGYTRRIAFVNLNTAGQGAPFLSDCIARDRAIDVRPAAPGSLMVFEIGAMDRAGNVTTWAAQPAVTVDASAFSCSGDPCLCCYLVNGVLDGPCAGQPGLVGSAAPAGACQP